LAPLSIGVVEESDGDLMGDGVNIAARFEGIAAPGAICLSEWAYWQVRGPLDLAVTDLGRTHLKNFVEPKARLSNRAACRHGQSRPSAARRHRSCRWGGVCGERCRETWTEPASFGFLGSATSYWRISPVPQQATERSPLPPIRATSALRHFDR
jgi:hypothetical protein